MVLSYIRNRIAQIKVAPTRAETIKDLILSLIGPHNSIGGLDETYEDAYIRIRFRTYDRGYGSPHYEYEIWVKNGDGSDHKVYHRFRNNSRNETDILIFRKGAWITHMKMLVKENINDADVFSEKRENVRFIGKTRERKLKFVEKKSVVPKDKTSRIKTIE